MPPKMTIRQLILVRIVGRHLRNKLVKLVKTFIMENIIKSHHTTYSVTIDIYELFSLNQQEECLTALVDLSSKLRTIFVTAKTAGFPVVDTGNDIAYRTVIISVTVGASLEAAQERLHNNLKQIHHNHLPEWCNSCGAKQESDCYCEDVQAYLS